jgi:hypothetical protein
LASAMAGIASMPRPLMSYRVHAGQQIGLRGAPPPNRWLRLCGRARRLGTRRVTVDMELEDRVVVARLVRDRLAAHARGSWPRTCLAEVEKLVAHLERRVAYASPRRRRIRPVASEWRSGRYARYSSGLLSAMADLARS